jgi:hypothetical protein
MICADAFRTRVGDCSGNRRQSKLPNLGHDAKRDFLVIWADGS